MDEEGGGIGCSAQPPFSPTYPPIHLTLAALAACLFPFLFCSALRFDDDDDDHISRTKPNHSTRRGRGRGRRGASWDSAEWDDGRYNQCHNKSTTAAAATTTTTTTTTARNQTTRRTRRARSSYRPHSKGRWYLECVSTRYRTRSPYSSCGSHPILDSIYTLDITVGSPQVSFSLFLDTGSSDFVRLVLLAPHSLVPSARDQY